MQLQCTFNASSGVSRGAMNSASSRWTGQTAGYGRSPEADGRTSACARPPAEPVLYFAVERRRLSRSRARPQRHVVVVPRAGPQLHAGGDVTEAALDSP